MSLGPCASPSTIIAAPGAGAGALAHCVRGALCTLATCGGMGRRDALEGKGPQRRPQRRLHRRLEEVPKAVVGGYCRLPVYAVLLGVARGTAYTPGPCRGVHCKWAAGWLPVGVCTRAADGGPDYDPPHPHRELPKCPTCHVGSGHGMALYHWTDM